MYILFGGNLCCPHPLLITPAATNITVSPGAVALTIDAPSSDQLWNPSITVTGTISDSSDYTVWVNGAMAALSGASWTATNVFLPPGGTAVIQARAIPNTDNGGNGTGGSGGGPASYNSLGNPGSSQAQDVEDQTDRQSRFYIDSYTITDNGTSTETDNYGYGAWDSSVANGVTTGKWVDGAGGSASWNFEDIMSGNAGNETNYESVDVVYAPTLYPDIEIATMDANPDDLDSPFNVTWNTPTLMRR